MTVIEGVEPANGKKYPEDARSRHVEHPTSYLETLVHLLKACFGTGILAMPEAFSKSGWAAGIVGTLLTGFICTYAIHMLIGSEQELSRRRKVKTLTYHTTWQAAFEDGPESLRWMAPYAPHITKLFFFFGLLGATSIYIVFMATNLKAVVDNYQDPLDRLNVRWYMLMLWVPLTLLNCVRNLKYLAPFSTIGTAASVVSYGIVIYYMFQDLPPLSSREPFGSWGGLPQFFGTALFAMECIGVVMPLKNEMRHPEQFGSSFGVLNVAMTPNLIMFMTVGFFGYLKYGEVVEPSVTLNLPGKDILAQTSRILLVLSIFITHPLNFYVSFDIGWNEYMSPRLEKNKLFIEYCVRTTLVTLTVLLAATVPYLDVIISLFGALVLTSLGLAVPAIIQLFTYWHHVHGFRFFLLSCKNFFIVFLGVMGMVIGTITSLQDLVHEINS
uniref:Proton-coupled amino acid transporter 4 n=1 Tax=Lygus hesperus TaxID=30085 RepID=A0A146M4N4_LYGHE